MSDVDLQFKTTAASLKEAQEVADQVNEKLPINLTGHDVEQYPEFVKLLQGLNQHLTEKGISRAVQKDLVQAEDALKQEKHAWLQFHILYLELQELILDFEIKSQDMAPSSASSQYYEALKDVVTLAELGDYLNCSLQADNEATLLGLTQEGLQRMNPYKKDMKAIQQKLVPEVEDRLRRKCENLVEFYEPLHDKDKEKLTFAKASQLPAFLEAEIHSIEEEKKLLKKEKSIREKHFRKYYQTLLESLHILEELITKHRLQSQTEKDGILTEWMAARCDAMCLKIRMVEMQILCDTYHTESVQALKAVSDNLQTAVHDHKAELHQVSQALTAYEAVGAGFDEMVSEYAKLRDEVANKRWALTELQQSLEDDG